MTAPPITDPVMGVSFPARLQFWRGDVQRCLGAGPRIKKVGFMSVKVYSVAMFVDAADAGQADVSEREPQSDAGALDVLQNGKFDKALQMHLVRGVSGKQFSDALDESLRPIMKGNEAVLDQFSSFFHGKQLEKGTEVTLLRRADGPIEVCLHVPSDQSPYSQARPELTIEAPMLGQALWQLYLSEKSPAPDARNAWLAAVKELGKQTAEARPEA